MSIPSSIEMFSQSHLTDRQPMITAEDEEEVEQEQESWAVNSTGASNK